MKNINLPSVPKHKKWQPLIAVLVIGISLLFLWPQIKVIRSDFHDITHLNLTKLLLSWLFISMANIPAAFVYWTLTDRRLPLKETTVAQFATGLSNRLLPAGIGAIGLNALFISKKLNVSKTKAASLAAANNLIGFIGFMLVFIIGALASSSNWHIVEFKIPFSKLALIGTPISLFIIFILATRQNKLARSIRSTIRIFYKTFTQLLGDPVRFFSTLFFSVLITLCYLMAFWMALQASNTSTNFIQLILIFAAGNIALSTTPTPGGIGGTELVLASALQIAGVAGGSALVISITYRIASFWLPILPGLSAGYYLRRRSSI